MHSYLPFNIVDVPSAIFHTHLRKTVTRELWHDVFGAKMAGTPMPPALRARLRWYPEVVSDMLDKSNQLLRLDEIADMLTVPPIGFHILIENYGLLAAEIEPKLLNSPEAAELILNYRRHKAGGPTTLDDSLLACMEEDPNRYIRNMSASEDRTARIMKLGDESAARRLESPAWAFAYLNSHHIDVLDLDLINVLQGGEEYAYLAARLLQNRGMAQCTWSPLVAEITSPRWVFHVMRENLHASDPAKFQKLLRQSPPWIVEYWTGAEFNQTALGDQYLETVRASYSHECMPELHAWYSSVMIKSRM